MNDVTVIWQGLKGISAAQRRALQEEVGTRVQRDFQSFYRRTYNQWLHGRWGGMSDPVRFARDLSAHEYTVIKKFNDSIDHDLTSIQYPPKYQFSGVKMAQGMGELAILDDYQATRRSLRYQLEARLQGMQYVYFVMSHAATSHSRFQYPNWAPWMPLHWFERLFEISEDQFGASDLTLALVSAYGKHLGDRESQLLPPIADVLTRTGLFEVPQSTEPEEAVPADPAPHAEAVAESPRLPANSALDGGNAALSGAETRDTREDFGNFSDATSGEEQWRFSNPLGTVPMGADEQTELARRFTQIPEDLPSEYVTPFLTDAFTALYGTMLNEWPQHPTVQSVFFRLQQDLAEIVARDRSFLTEPKHPLRLWFSSIFALGCRFHSEQVPRIKTPEGRYFAFLKGSVEQFIALGTRMTPQVAAQWWGQWRDKLDQEDRIWLEQCQNQHRTSALDESLLHVLRDLQRCVAESGQSPPLTAVPAIMSSWLQLRASLPHPEHELAGLMRRIVCAIGVGLPPKETAADIIRLKGLAQQEGMSEVQIQSLLKPLGSAHLLALRAAPTTKRFDPLQPTLPALALALTDDDPAILENDWVAEEDAVTTQVEAMPLGAWFEFAPLDGAPVRRMRLIWRGDGSRAQMFLALDGQTLRLHSLAGGIQELRSGRLRPLPDATWLDQFLPRM